MSYHEPSPILRTVQCWKSLIYKVPTKVPCVFWGSIWNSARKFPEARVRYHQLYKTLPFFFNPHPTPHIVICQVWDRPEILWRGKCINLNETYSSWNYMKFNCFLIPKSEGKKLWDLHEVMPKCRIDIKHLWKPLIKRHKTFFQNEIMPSTATWMD